MAQRRWLLLSNNDNYDDGNRQIDTQIDLKQNIDVGIEIDI